MVLEGGTEGVDAEAVKAAFEATAPFEAEEEGRIIWCVTVTRTTRPSRRAPFIYE